MGKTAKHMLVLVIAFSFILILVIPFSLTLLSSCKELTEDQKIMQRLESIPKDAETIDLKDYFTFEWDEVIIPSAMYEKTVGELMGQPYTLYQNLDKRLYITSDTQRVDESGTPALIFFHNKELVYEFYYYYTEMDVGFGEYDYVITSDNCEFSVEVIERSGIFPWSNSCFLRLRQQKMILKLVRYWGNHYEQGATEQMLCGASIFSIQWVLTQTEVFLKSWIALNKGIQCDTPCGLKLEI